MSDAARIYETSVTVPAGTLPTAPQVTSWVTEDNDVLDIEVEIPPGHNGLTGIRVMKGDVQLLPFGINSWLIANDYSRVFPVGIYLPTVDVKVQAYNQGSFPHTFYLRMTVVNHTVPVPAASPGTGAPLTFGETTSAPDPLSPDAILGPDTTAGLVSGDLTAADLTPIVPQDVTVSEPVTTGP